MRLVYRQACHFSANFRRSAWPELKTCGLWDRQFKLTFSAIGGGGGSAHLKGNDLVISIFSRKFQINFLGRKRKRKKNFKGFSILLFNVKLPFCFPFLSHWNFRYFPGIFLIFMLLSLVLKSFFVSLKIFFLFILIFFYHFSKKISAPCWIPFR